jgi:hypothetical protein
MPIPKHQADLRRNTSGIGSLIRSAEPITLHYPLNTSMDSLEVRPLHSQRENKGINGKRTGKRRG